MQPFYRFDGTGGNPARSQLAGVAAAPQFPTAPRVRNYSCARPAIPALCTLAD